MCKLLSKKLKLLFCWVCSNSVSYTHHLSTPMIMGKYMKLAGGIVSLLYNHLDEETIIESISLLISVFFLITYEASFNYSFLEFSFILYIKCKFLHLSILKKKATRKRSIWQLHYFSKCYCQTTSALNRCDPSI